MNDCLSALQLVLNSFKSFNEENKDDSLSIIFRKVQKQFPSIERNAIFDQLSEDTIISRLCFKHLIYFYEIIEEEYFKIFIEENLPFFTNYIDSQEIISNYIKSLPLQFPKDELSKALLRFIIRNLNIEIKPEFEMPLNIHLRNREL